MPFLGSLIDATNNNCEVRAQRKEDYLPLHPRIVLVGPINEIAAHVHVVDITYTLANVCEAFEAALNASLHWIASNICDRVRSRLVRRVYVFGISTPYDKK